MKTVTALLLFASTVQADLYADPVLDPDPGYYNRHQSSTPIADRFASPPTYYPPAPTPVMPIERGVLYNSNQFGSSYFNSNTGVMCFSNRFGSSCN